MELKSGYSDSSSNTAQLDIFVQNELNSRNYDITVKSSNIYVQYVTVEILFIDPTWYSSTTKEYLFKKKIWNQIGSTDTTLLIDSDPALLIYGKNYFIGLTSFKIINTIFIYDCRIINN